MKHYINQLVPYSNRKTVELHVPDMKIRVKEAMLNSGLRATIDGFCKMAKLSGTLFYNAINNYNAKNKVIQDVYGYVSLQTYQKMMDTLNILEGFTDDMDITDMFDVKPDKKCKIKDELEEERQEHIKAARQLFYTNDVIEQLHNAKTVNELDRILTTARKKASVIWDNE